MAMMRLFRENKISGWRRHQPLAGTPDFAFRKPKVVVFVDGCFWHGCKKHGVRTSMKPFWKNKFLRNKQRDLFVNRTLRSQGWRVMRVWEHDLSRRNEARLLRRIQTVLSANK